MSKILPWQHLAPTAMHRGFRMHVKLHIVILEFLVMSEKMKMNSTKRIKKIGFESKRRQKNLEDDRRHLQARLQVHHHHRKESYHNPRNRK